MSSRSLPIVIQKFTWHCSWVYTVTQYATCYYSEHYLCILQWTAKQVIAWSWVMFHYYLCILQWSASQMKAWSAGMLYCLKVYLSIAVNCKSSNLDQCIPFISQNSTCILQWTASANLIGSQDGHIAMKLWFAVKVCDKCHKFVILCYALNTLLTSVI